MDDMTTTAREPVDADVDIPAEQSARRPGEARVLLVVSAGGVLGGVGRYQAGVWWATAPGHFPWTTFWINVCGCALIGVLLVLVSDVFTTQQLVRPFLGTGVLGGFTTFSTYAVDIQHLIATGHPVLALGDLAATVVAAMVAVTGATWATRRLVGVAR